MSNKYEMRICNCGRIHMIPMGKINKALDEEKELLLICGSCGQGSLIGADIGPDWDNPSETCYNMYTHSIPYREDMVITPSSFESTDDHKGISEIYFSHGIPVPMNSGYNAQNYFDGRFSDLKCPNLNILKQDDITSEKAINWVNEHIKRSNTVNMKRFVSSTPEDTLEEIASHYIKGFNWTGTKYEKKGIKD